MSINRQSKKLAKYKKSQEKSQSNNKFQSNDFQTPSNLHKQVNSIEHDQFKIDMGQSLDRDKEIIFVDGGKDIESEPYVYEEQYYSERDEQDLVNEVFGINEDSDMIQIQQKAINGGTGEMADDIESPVQNKVKQIIMVSPPNENVIDSSINATSQSDEYEIVDATPSATEKENISSEMNAGISESSEYVSNNFEDDPQQDIDFINNISQDEVENLDSVLSDDVGYVKGDNDSSIEDPDQQDKISKQFANNIKPKDKYNLKYLSQPNEQLNSNLEQIDSNKILKYESNLQGGEYDEQLAPSDILVQIQLKSDDEAEQENNIYMVTQSVPNALAHSQQSIQMESQNHINLSLDKQESPQIQIKKIGQQDQPKSKCTTKVTIIMVLLIISGAVVYFLIREKQDTQINNK